MLDIKKTFIDNLREIHTSSGMTQVFVAGKIGVKKQTFQYWISGRSEPSFNYLGRLAGVYGIDCSRFFEEHKRAA